MLRQVVVEVALAAHWGSRDYQGSLPKKVLFSTLRGYITKKTSARVYNLVIGKTFSGGETL